MKKQKQNLRTALKEITGSVPKQFYRQPMLHINCNGQVQVENCKAVLEYGSQMLRLDMGSWDVVIWGSDLELCGLGGTLLVLKGKVFKTELFYKEDTRWGNSSALHG